MEQLGYYNFEPNIQLLKEFFIKDELALLGTSPLFPESLEFPMWYYQEINDLLNTYKIDNEQIVVDFFTIVVYILFQKIGTASFNPELNKLTEDVAKMKSLIRFLIDGKITEIKFLGEHTKSSISIVDQPIIDLFLNSFWKKIVSTADPKEEKLLSVQDSNKKINLLSFLLDGYKKHRVSEEEKFSLIGRTLLSEDLEKTPRYMNIIGAVNKKRGRRPKILSEEKRKIKSRILEYFDSQPELNNLPQAKRNHLGASLFAWGGLLMDEPDYKEYEKKKYKKNKASSYKSYRDYLSINWYNI